MPEELVEEEVAEVSIQEEQGKGATFSRGPSVVAKE